MKNEKRNCRIFVVVICLIIIAIGARVKETAQNVSNIANERAQQQQELYNELFGE